MKRVQTWGMSRGSSMTDQFQRNLGVTSSTVEKWDGVEDQFFVISNQSRRILFANIAATERNGYAPGALSGVPFDSLLSEHQGASAVLHLFSNNSDRRGPVRVEMRSADNLEYRAWLSVTPVPEQSLFVLQVRPEETSKVSDEMVTLKARIQILERALLDKDVAIAEMRKDLDEYTYAVSHDLRAPLRAVDGFSAALRNELGKDVSESASIYLDRIREAAVRIGAMIDGLLALSRVDRQHMSPGPVNMSSLVRSISDDLVAQETSRLVKVEVAPDIMGYGDLSMLRTVVENLLRNAWAFTKTTPEPHIQFEMLASDEPELVFRVRDNGVGFRSDHADKLFTIFQRLHSQNQFPGIGVGLALVKQIVRRHGGRCWAEGEVGKGASFYFTLRTEHASIGREAV